MTLWHQLHVTGSRASFIKEVVGCLFRCCDSPPSSFPPTQSHLAIFSSCCWWGNDKHAHSLSMTILYRGDFVLLLCKSGSCITKPQWTTRSIPSLKACRQLVLVLRSFPKHILGGPTAEGSCHIKGQPSEQLTCQIKGLSPSASFHWTVLLPSTSFSQVAHYAHRTNQI